MRQRHIAWQRDRLSAEFFVLLLLLPPELLRLVKQLFGLSQRLSKLLVSRAEFAVFGGLFLGTRSLLIATSKETPSRFVPRRLVLSN